MLAAIYVASALVAGLLMIRAAPGLKQPTHFWVKVIGVIFFGYMAYAGIAKGLEAISSGDTRLSNRLGLGRIANRSEIVFWAQLMMCWCASVLGTAIALVLLLAPRPRGA